MKDLAKTVAQLSPQKRAALELLLVKRKGEARAKIRPAARSDRLPLSFAQQRIWFLERLEGDSGAYNVAMSWRLDGELDIAALHLTLSEIVRRHEALRTIFPLQDGAPVQLILDPSPLQLVRVDLRGADSNVLQQTIDRAAKVPFDLERGPLIRASLITLGDQSHVLSISMHHIICDGWSIGVLTRELCAIYGAFRQGRSHDLPELPIQYADYAVWQRQHLTPDVLAREGDHWIKALDGAPELLDLAGDRVRPAVQRFHGKTKTFSFDPLLSSRVKAFAQSSNATPFMVLLSAWSAMLARRSTQEDILIGSPIAHRTASQTEGLIGCFINTLVLRTKPRLDSSFRELLSQARAAALDAYEHQDFPFEQLIERLQPERSLSHTPLFQVMFILQNAPPPKYELPGVVLSHLSHENSAAKLDLTLTVKEGASGFSGALEYNLDLFDDATIGRMIEHFTRLLSAAIAGPDKKLWDLPMAGPAERSQLLDAFNDTARVIEGPATVPEMFFAQAALTPEKIAVEDDHTALSYRDLAARARALAAHLVSSGVAPGSNVGLLCDRSVDLVVSLLAIMSAGAAYVPLDPSFPKQRLQHMVRDARLAAMVLQDDLQSLLDLGELPVVRLSSQLNDGASVPVLDAEANAYLLYTSGSTGRPKGVEVSQRALVNLLRAMERSPGISSSDVLVAVTTISFDISGLEIYLPLVSGARLVIASKLDAQDGARLRGKLDRSGATMMQATPTTWRLLLAAGWTPWPSFKILVGGEALPLDLLDVLRAGGGPVFNLYGPTETTIWSTSAEVSRVESSPPPIGRPIDNTRAYVLGRFGELMPIGVPGELLLGGSGLARGYFGDPELTFARFVASPVPEREGERLYRTGDRARWRADGQLEFLGRVDLQVKLRGFRIELSEIEAVLAEHAAIDRAAAVIRDQRLIAYYVPRGAVTLDELRAHLKTSLPDYMVPAALVAMDSFPLTPNGKVDRAALPSPEDRGLAIAVAPPQDAIERELVLMMQDLLHVSPIGVDQSFFDLGGHSLLAVTLCDRIERAFKKAIPLMTLFAKPTVRELAEVLRSDLPPPSRALEILQPKGGKTPLFFIGSTPYARALIPFLSEEQPLYGLNIFGLERFDESWEELDLRSVAEQFVREVLITQSRGPYKIAAYCADAILAYEVAQQLTARGHEVAMLAFIDTVWGLGEEDGFDLAGFFRNVREQGTAFIAQKFRRRWKRLETRQKARHDRRSIDDLRDRGEAVPLNLRHKELVRSYRRALAEYQARPYAGRITLFISQELRMRRQPDLLRLASGGLEPHEIPGFHDALFEEPQIQYLGRELKACLDD